MKRGFLVKEGFPDASDSKESACNVGDQGSILGLGRRPGIGNGNSLQCSCVENPKDRRPGGVQSTGSQTVRQD